jgi:hypothetical protein
MSLERKCRGCCNLRDVVRDGAQYGGAHSSLQGLADCMPPYTHCLYPLPYPPPPAAGPTLTSRWMPPLAWMYLSASSTSLMMLAMTTSSSPCGRAHTRAQAPAQGTTAGQEELVSVGSCGYACTRDCCPMTRGREKGVGGGGGQGSGTLSPAKDALVAHTTKQDAQCCCCCNCFTAGAQSVLDACWLLIMGPPPPPPPPAPPVAVGDVCSLLTLLAVAGG